MADNLIHSYHCGFRGKRLTVFAVTLFIFSIRRRLTKEAKIGDCFNDLSKKFDSIINQGKHLSVSVDKSLNIDLLFNKCLMTVSLRLSMSATILKALDGFHCSEFALPTHFPSDFLLIVYIVNKST